MSLNIPEGLRDTVGGVISEIGAPQFTQEQIETARGEIQERTGISPEEIDEAMVQQYLRLGEDIRSRLDLLSISSTENMREKIGAFHALLEEHARDLPDVQTQIREQAETAVRSAAETATNRVVDVAQERVTSGINSWVERIIPESVRNLFGDGVNIGQAIWTWIVGLFSGTWLGKLFSSENTEESTEEVGTDSEVETQSEDGETQEETDTGVSENRENEQNMSQRQLFYKIVGQQFLRQVSGEIIPTSNSYRNIVQRLEQKTYGEIQSVYRNFLASNGDTNILKNLLVINGDASIFENVDDSIIQSVFEMIAGINAVEIIGERLGGEKYKELAQGESFAQYFGADTQSRILSSNNLGELSYQDMSVLIGFSLPPVIIGSLQSSIGNISGMIFGEESELDALFISDMQERRNQIIPEALLSQITTSGGRIQSPEDLKLLVGYENLSETDRTYVDNLIHFGESVTQTIVNSERFNLGTTRFEELFTSSLSYREIVYLYTLLDGNDNLESIGDFESSLVYFWIYGVLSKNQTQEAAGSYIGSLTRAILDDDDDRFTDVQRSLISKNMGRAGDEAVRTSFNVVSGLRYSGREVVRQELADQLGISPDMIPDAALDTTEVMVILALLGSNVVISRVPLPLHIKIILNIAVGSVGITWMISFLYDKGVFTKLLSQAGSYEHFEQLNQLVQRETGFDIETLSQYQEEGRSFESLSSI